MESLNALSRKVMVVWDNFGPTHIDRVVALASRGVDVLAVEIFASSDVYLWDRPSASGRPRITMFKQREVSAVRIGWQLMRLVLSSKSRFIFLCHYERSYIFATALICRIIGRDVYIMNDSKFDDYPRQFWREALKRILHSPYVGGVAASTRVKTVHGVPRIEEGRSSPRL